MIVPHPETMECENSFFSLHFKFMRKPYVEYCNSYTTYSPQHKKEVFHDTKVSLIVDSDKLLPWCTRLQKCNRVTRLAISFHPFTVEIAECNRHFSAKGLFFPSLHIALSLLVFLITTIFEVLNATSITNFLNTSPFVAFSQSNSFAVFFFHLHSL